MSIPKNDPSCIRSLASAENQFLQVLVYRFILQRKEQGFLLKVAIGDDSDAIWSREAKEKIRAGLSFKKGDKIKNEIKKFMASDKDVYEYNDPSFCFRLGNGGTLPIVRMNGQDYFCLFYRDSYPAGWNIANGGANTKHDILHPDEIVERELREELIIVEPEMRCWYIFDWHEARLRDHPDFALAQKLWKMRFSERGYDCFEHVTLPLKWSIPPDADYTVLKHHQHDTIYTRYGNAPAIHTGKGFININTEDFGIEFDRIAKIAVNTDAVFCDGELRDDILLNRVVGLFPVQEVLHAMDEGEHSFIPKHCYWDGENRTGEDIKNIVENFLQSTDSSWGQLKKNLQIGKAANSPVRPFDLCPVTRTIIGRYKNLMSETASSPPAIDPFKVFISFASEDRQIAGKVFEYLSGATGKNIFFSDVSLTRGGFSDQIDRALDDAEAFLAVGTNVRHLNKSWVEYEWRNFHNDMKSKRKDPHSPFFAFVAGIDPNDMPRPLRQQTAVQIDIDGMENALAKAAKRLSLP